MPRTAKQFEEIRSERREAILSAALHVFSEEGYHHASISKVSKEAGVSKGLMYNYFQSKEELLELLIGSLLDEETKVVHKLMEEKFTTDTFIRLVQMGTNILRKNPKKWKLYLNMSSHPSVIPIIQKKFTPERQLFAENLLAFFTAQGYQDPAIQMQYFSITMTGFKFQYIMDPDNFPVFEMETKIIQQFIKEDYVSNRNNKSL